jgi:gas vesicle protein
MKNSAVWEAFLTGASFGIVVGLLLAPDKGENTRNVIGDQLKNLGDNLKDYDFADLASKGFQLWKALK